MTLNDFESHTRLARLFEDNSLKIYAVFCTISPDSAYHAVAMRQPSILYMFTVKT